MGQIGECERNRPALRLVHYSDACWKDGGGYGSTYRLASNQCTYTMHMHIPIYTLIPGSRGSQENNVRDRDALSALDGGREPHCGGQGARAQETRRTYPTHMRKQRATGTPGDENKDSQVSTTCLHRHNETGRDAIQPLVTRTDPTTNGRIWPGCIQIRFRAWAKTKQETYKRQHISNARCWRNDGRG